MYYTYRISALIVGTHTIPGDDKETGWTEAGVVSGTDEPASAVEFIVRSWTSVVHNSCCPRVYISPVGSDHWSPSKWEGSWSGATSGSSSQGDIAIVVDLQWQNTQKSNGNNIYIYMKIVCAYLPECIVVLYHRSGKVDASFAVYCCHHL